MKYTVLGRSGLRVSELCLGTMTFGEDWDFGASKEESRRIFDAYCAAGGNFIDTANTYTFGSSETFVGEFVASERAYYVLSTKYSLSTQPRDPNGGGNHRKNLVHAIEQSLRRMRTEYVDMYWVHVWDFTTPVAEVMRGLDDLVRSGKVLHVGISNTPAWIVSQAHTLAELRGWSSFAGIQVEYNLIERGSERDLMPMAEALGLGVLAWAPLAGGVLTGKYLLTNDEIRVDDSKRGGWLNSQRLTRDSMRIVAALLEVAQEIGRSPAEIAINWVKQQSARVVPIVGGRTLGQMRQNLGCLEFEIPAPQMDSLNRASRIEPGYPHGFLASAPVQQALFGETRGRLNIPRRLQFLSDTIIT